MVFISFRYVCVEGSVSILGSSHVDPERAEFIRRSRFLARIHFYFTWDSYFAAAFYSAPHWEPCPFYIFL